MGTNASVTNCFAVGKNSMSLATCNFQTKPSLFSGCPYDRVCPKMIWKAKTKPIFALQLRLKTLFLPWGPLHTCVDFSRSEKFKTSWNSNFSAARSHTQNKQNLNRIHKKTSNEVPSHLPEICKKFYWLREKSTQVWSGFQFSFGPRLCSFLLPFLQMLRRVTPVWRDRRRLRKALLTVAFFVCATPIILFINAEGKQGDAVCVPRVTSPRQLLNFSFSFVSFRGKTDCDFLCWQKGIVPCLRKHQKTENIAAHRRLLHHHSFWAGCDLCGISGNCLFFFFVALLFIAASNRRSSRLDQANCNVHKIAIRQLVQG